MDEQVFSFRNDHDKDLEALATTLCSCRLALDTGTCDHTQCANCNTAKKFSVCYNELATCDQLRVENMTGKMYYQAYALRPDTIRNKKQRRHFISKMCFIIGLLIALNTIPVMCYIRPCDTKNNIQNIEAVIKIELAATMQDVNRDGLVDCIDYSIFFKQVWDILYPNKRYECEIVRNVNKITGMNHLFVRVWYYTDWIYIEPQADLKYYLMQDVWGDKYDPKYNILGETNKWLKEGINGYKRF